MFLSNTGSSARSDESDSPVTAVVCVDQSGLSDSISPRISPRLDAALDLLLLEWTALIP